MSRIEKLRDQVPKTIDKFEPLAEKAIRIKYSDDLTWKEKWHIVFKSPSSLKKQIEEETDITIDPHIPDTSYKEEAKVYLGAVEDRYKEIFN